MPYLRRNGDKAEKEFLNLLSQEFLIMATEQSMELGEKKKINQHSFRRLEGLGLQRLENCNAVIHSHPSTLCF